MQVPIFGWFRACVLHLWSQNRKRSFFCISDCGSRLGPGLPIVSIVVSLWGYLIESYLYTLLNVKKELQWRLYVRFRAGVCGFRLLRGRSHPGVIRLMI